MFPSKKHSSKRISSTSWIGSVGGQFDDFQVDVDNERPVGSSVELKNHHCLIAEIQSKDSSNGDDNDVKVTSDGLATINLTRGKGCPKDPLHASQLTTTPATASSTTEPLSAPPTHTNTHRSSNSSRNRASRDRLSIFTSHTTTTFVSSTYHSSDLDSLSEGVSDSELDSDDDSIEASTNTGESSPEDGEDDIKSILSSDFDSKILDLEEPQGSGDDSSAGSEERDPAFPNENQRKAVGWTTDMRWNTLESSPSVKSDPFASAELLPHTRVMISNSSMFVQVAQDDNDNVKSSIGGGSFVDIRLSGDDEHEYVVPYNDGKEMETSNVADILEHDPSSEHTSFLLELKPDLQRNVSGLTVQSGMGRRRPRRTTRRGGKRNRHMDTHKNETWNDEDVAANKRTSDTIPNQPLPPPPPPSETPPLPRGRALKDSMPQRPSPRWSRSCHSKVSRVSELSTPTMEETKSLNPTNLRRNSNDGSFESSWASTIISPSPPTPKSIKKLRVDGTESSGDGLSSHDNPTFHAANIGAAVASLDIPPPPPARLGTPSSFLLPPPPPPPLPPGTPDTLISNDGRPLLVNMRTLSKTSTITFDSVMSTPTVKERNRQNLERLNDQMHAAIGVNTRTMLTAATKSSSTSNLSIVQRRESVKRLREKLQDSFRSAISPISPRGRKKKADASAIVPSIPNAPITVLRDSSRSPTRQYRHTPIRK
mmetsp:Transcript_22355/g.55285  ORF Transcript_22355/g.55285 Transcript_22355/m.55285 type:complete len:709 (+) Transcript_22355:56-2182(+)